MNREKRTIFLVVLTLVTYGISIFLDKGSFILPFPIFDFILIVVALQFAFWNWRDIFTFRKWYFYLYFLAILVKLSTNQILWSIILDDKDLAIFNETLVLDTLRLVHLILLFLSILCWSFVEKLKYKLILKNRQKQSNILRNNNLINNNNKNSNFKRNSRNNNSFNNRYRH